jgi:hypothetical protein
MSARNTSGYLQMTGMDNHIAIMTGIALIVFSSTCFTAAHLFMAHKGAVKLFSLLFIFVGPLVIMFSIFATLSLNYARFLTSDAIQSERQAEIDRQRSEIINRQNIVAQDTSQQTREWIMDTIDRYTTMAENTGIGWSMSMGRILEAADRVSDIQAQEIINDMIFVETIPETFFAFILGFGEWDTKYYFDFFMLAIPATLYDLLAPLSLTVVLFLMGWKPAPELEAPEKLTSGVKNVVTKRQLKRRKLQLELFPVKAADND